MGRMKDLAIKLEEMPTSTLILRYNKVTSPGFDDGINEASYIKSILIDRGVDIL